MAVSDEYLGYLFMRDRDGNLLDAKGEMVATDDP